MNFVLANASLAAAGGARAGGPAAAAVEFVRPTVRRDCFGGGRPCAQGPFPDPAAAGLCLHSRHHCVLSSVCVTAQLATTSPFSFFSVQRRVDISKLSGVGISHNWGGFMTSAQVRAW